MRFCHSYHRGTSHPGFALVIVLGILVLLTVLVIAFFSSITTDYTSTKQYSSGAATKQLADSVVQVVMGQIKSATTGSNVSWASQPGMIRTYDATGNPGTNYKLYSSDAMTTAGALTFAQVSDFDAAWSTKPALWTDLNAPVTDDTGNANFPIIDGNNIKPLSVDGSGTSVSSYLGYDGINNSTLATSPDGLPDVQGFGVDPTAPAVTYNSTKPLMTSNTPVPMPVKWMYQLRDGTLLTPDTTGNSTTVATFNTATNPPSTSNPIVGRFAFWTDDESSKVNVNTAAQGTYWDTPHFTATVPAYTSVTAATASQFTDYAYATFQPALFEFQRYPGHPAQVALNSVFPGVTSATAAGVAPRISTYSSSGSAAGSQGGTVYPGNTPIDQSKAPRKALYASVDEYLYSGTTGTPRTVNQLQINNAQALVPLTKAQMEEAKFFLTANSRAPEVNLFEKPRVCMWPISSALASNASTPYTTAFDRLIAFCATLHNGPATGNTQPYRYYFQRGNSQSSTSDYTNIPDNQKLYAYLQTLMSQPVPGFGSSFTSKYPTDSNQILTEIFDYIRCTNLSDPNLCPDPANPGRSTLASLAAWTSAPYVFANYEPEPASPIGDTYCGQVMPIQITANGPTMGFGRYYTVKDVSMVFICTGDGRDGPMPVNAPPPPAPQPTIYQQSNDTTTVTTRATYNPSLVGQALTIAQKRMQMAIYLNYFLPSPGQLKCGPDMPVRISNLDQINITNATNIDATNVVGPVTLFPSNTPPTASGWVGKLMATGFNGYNPIAVVPSIRVPFAQHRSPLYYRSVYASSSNGKIIYPFISRAFTIANGAAISLAPVTLKIELFQAKGAYDNNDSALSSTYKAPGAPTYNAILSDPNNANLIQTIYVNIQAGTFPQPNLAVNSASGNSVVGLPTAQSPQGAWGFDGKIASAAIPTQQNSALIAQASTGSTCYDTVRTVSVLSGDARLVAASNLVPQTSTLFGVNDLASYNNILLQSYHYFVENGAAPIGAQSGKMVPGIGSVGLSPYCPLNTEVNYCKYGDWDGPDVRVGSGAFINKPDEGDNADLSTSGNSSSIPYYGYTQSTARNIYLYTPNRIMPSPGMLGSLSTGVLSNRPWQTLLFRPPPPVTTPPYPNAAVPTTGPPYTVIPDHLLMDLFWMPVVEPYAISEAFSTAGKINLNYQIAPFTYITRSTALASLLKSEKIAARPISVDTPSATQTSMKLRLDINPSESGGTLQQVKATFATGNIFRSATQVCDLDLVPFTDPSGSPQTWNSTWGSNFWQANANTGDNLRERPYANLYARLTTKSNTYTVHVRVQSLQKVIGTSPTQWVEGKDRIASEYRGSSLIERYVDPADPTLPDFADPLNAGKNLDSYYKFRVISTKKFAP